MNKLRALTSIFILAIFTVSCSLPGQPTLSPGGQSSDQDQIGTIVAQTVEAKSLPTVTEDVTETETIPTTTATEMPTLPAVMRLRVSYIDGNRSLWLWEEGGTSILLDQSGEVTSSKISPDGEMVMFVRSPDWIRSSIWVVNSDGSDMRELVSQAKFNEILSNPGLLGLTSADFQNAVAVGPYWLDWIPESHIIAYNTSPKYEGPGLAVHNDLWQVDADSGQISLLLKAGEGGNFYYSPDGEQIALVTPEDISLINADLSNRRTSVLQYPAALTYSEHMYYPEPVWSADSSYLLVDIPPREIMEQPPEPNTIYRIPADGSQPAHLASLYPIWFRTIFFSPDRTRIIYLTREGPAENNQCGYFGLPKSTAGCRWRYEESSG